MSTPALLEEPRELGAPLAPKPFALAPTRVLLAEDDEVLSEALGRRLAERGFSVTTVTDGASALDIALAQQHDVILTDLLLPRMSGLKLLRALHDGRLRNPPPVVVLTAASDVEAYYAHCRGASAVLRKPTHIDTLVSILRRAVEESES